MSKTSIPAGYSSCLGIYDTQKAIGLLKRLFEDALSGALHLRRVSAPIFVEAASGLNDDLNGVERPVSFDVPATKNQAQVVHSLAKWKRMALYKYGFYPGNGIYADMNAIRRDEEMDSLHSIYVDQWDWEKVITPEQRNMEFLKKTVNEIMGAICSAHDTVRSVFPQLTKKLCPAVTFIQAQELEDMYPDLSPKQREEEFVRQYKTVFITGVGGKLNSGKPHDGRAPDYDDWNLNGDLLLWSDTLGRAVELSSMGIRVDPETLERQLIESGCTDRRELPFHKLLLEGRLPLTIGGGIGQSRLCMLLLEKAHVGEVQVSVWDEETKNACEAAGVFLL